MYVHVHIMYYSETPILYITANDKFIRALLHSDSSGQKYIPIM